MFHRFDDAAPAWRATRSNAGRTARRGRSDRPPATTGRSGARSFPRLCSSVVGRDQADAARSAFSWASAAARAGRRQLKPSESGRSQATAEQVTAGHGQSPIAVNWRASPSGASRGFLPKNSSSLVYRRPFRERTPATLCGPDPELGRHSNWRSAANWKAGLGRASTMLHRALQLHHAAFPPCSARAECRPRPRRGRVHWKTCRNSPRCCSCLRSSRRQPARGFPDCGASASTRRHTFRNAPSCGWRQSPRSDRSRLVVAPG